MTSKKLSELQGTDQVASNDLFLVTNGADSKKITRQDLFQLIFNTTMNKISDLPTMDEADASSDLTGNSILVVNNGVEKIIPLSELKKVVEEAAAAVAYDDTNTNFGTPAAPVDNVQAAIEALFALATAANPGTVYISDVAPTATGSVTNKVYDGTRLQTFDTTTEDLTVTVVASIESLQQPTVTVNGVPVVWSGNTAGVYTGTAAITIAGSMDILAANTAGSSWTAAATVLSQPVPTIESIYFSGSANETSPGVFTDIYVSATAWINASPNLPNGNFPPTAAPYYGAINPSLSTTVTELMRGVPLYLIVKTTPGSDPVDMIDVTGGPFLTGAGNSIGVYTATQIAANTYSIGPMKIDVFVNLTNGVPAYYSASARARSSVNAQYGPVFNGASSPAAPIGSNLYATVTCNSATPSYVCSIGYDAAAPDTDYNYPGNQTALKTGEQVTISFRNITNASSVNNDYFIFTKLTTMASDHVQLAGSETTVVGSSKIFELAPTAPDYYNGSVNLASYMVRRSNGRVSNPIYHLVRIAKVPAKATVRFFTLDNNGDPGTLIGSKSLRSGGGGSVPGGTSVNQQYWAIIAFDQTMRPFASATPGIKPTTQGSIPTVSPLPANSGNFILSWTDFIAPSGTLPSGMPPTGMGFKNLITISDNDERKDVSLGFSTAVNMSGMESDWDFVSSPTADKFYIKGFVTRGVNISLANNKTADIEVGSFTGPNNKGVVDITKCVVYKDFVGSSEVYTYQNSPANSSEKRFTITDDAGGTNYNQYGHYLKICFTGINSGIFFIEETI